MNSSKEMYPSANNMRAKKRKLIWSTAIIALLIVMGLLIPQFRYIHAPLVSEFQKEMKGSFESISSIRISISRPSAFLDITLNEAENADFDEMLEKAVRYIHENSVYEKVIVPKSNGSTVWAKYLRIRFYVREGLTKVLLREHKSGSLDFDLNALTSRDFVYWQTDESGGQSYLFEDGRLVPLEIGIETQGHVGND